MRQSIARRLFPVKVWIRTQFDHPAPMPENPDPAPWPSVNRHTILWFTLMRRRPIGVKLIG